MPIGHALLISIFLILVAVSAALVASMVVLALFNLAFGKGKPSKAAEIESGQEEFESGRTRAVEERRQTNAQAQAFDSTQAQ